MSRLVVGSDVGLRVGFRDLPDKICLSQIKGLSAACRKCRDFQRKRSHPSGRMFR